VSAITWRTMDIPSFRDSMQAMPAVGASFNRASDDLKGMLTDYNTRQDANWNQGIKNNTNTLLAESQQANDLNSFNANDPSYSIQGIKDRFGVQVNQDDVLAGRLKQKGLLNEAAANAAYSAGNATFNTTTDRPTAIAAMQKSLTDSGVRESDQFKIIGDYNTGTKDIQEGLTKNVTSKNTQEAIGQLNLSNLQDVLKEGKTKYKDLFDSAAIIAQHKSLTDTAIESGVSSAMSATKLTGNPSDGVMAISGADMPSDVKISAMERLQKLSEGALKPSALDELNYKVAEEKNNIAFKDRIAEPTAQLANLQELSKTLSDGEAVTKAAAIATGNKGVARDITDTLEEKPWWKLWFGDNNTEIKGMIAKHRASLVTGDNRVSETEADEIINRAGKNLSLSKNGEFDEAHFKEEVLRLGDQTNNYKTLSSKIASLSKGIQNDTDAHTAGTELSRTEYATALNKQKLAGGAVDANSFHKGIAPGELKSEKLYKSLGIKTKEERDAEAATKASDAQAKAKANADKLRGVAPTVTSKDTLNISFDDAVKLEKTHNAPEGTLDLFLRNEGGNRVGKPIKTTGTNPKSSATGVMQFTSATAKEEGIDPNDPVASINAALSKAAKNANALTKVLGRPADKHDVYLAHQQGLAGAKAILSHPNDSAVDSLIAIGVSPERAKASILNNHGKLTDTAAMFTARQRKYGKDTEIADMENKLINSAV